MNRSPSSQATVAFITAILPCEKKKLLRLSQVLASHGENFSRGSPRLDWGLGGGIFHPPPLFLVPPHIYALGEVGERV